ncbi:hypothetical protein VII00023_09990 [Vibrio ichthyoenteri ATCC 700023]|uniref:N-acetylglutamate synthase n=1 Tax=Vibrio ichthyoenteri ATCC 700023 TaxID=870968 RepID=F9RWA5_9VIBR|nr:DUF2850 domain-containing protein [Vibrio ichthyoenteri]EGU49358.1 hypothetical protein VII00023_09990 [Vibrio ichthyoenteri ATCC 700023]
MNVSTKSSIANKQSQSGRFFARKWMNVAALVVALICAYFVVQTGLWLNSKYQQVSHPPSLIYGTWVEDNVAPYLAETIVINQSGVTVNGGVVGTQFSFDGNTFRYQHGSQQRVFHFDFGNFNSMKLDTDVAYQPVYVKTL